MSFVDSIQAKTMQKCVSSTKLKPIWGWRKFLIIVRYPLTKRNIDLSKSRLSLKQIAKNDKFNGLTQVLCDLQIYRNAIVLKLKYIYMWLGAKFKAKILLCRLMYGRSTLVVACT